MAAGAALCPARAAAAAADHRRELFLRAVRGGADGADGARDALFRPFRHQRGRRGGAWQRRGRAGVARLFRLCAGLGDTGIRHRQGADRAVPATGPPLPAAPRRFETDPRLRQQDQPALHYRGAGHPHARSDRRQAGGAGRRGPVQPRDQPGRAIPDADRRSHRQRVLPHFRAHPRQGRPARPGLPAGLRRIFGAGAAGHGGAGDHGASRWSCCSTAPNGSTPRRC